MDGILSRQWILCGSDVEEQFGVLQWNVLADALTKSSPISNFYKVSMAALEWNHRRGLILAEIQRSGADLVCLEEVDHYSDFLLPEMTKMGFDGIFIGKPRSACLDFPQNNGPDGCALFYRKSMFTLKDKREVQYYESGNPSNQVAVLLRLAIHERPLCIAVTHLKSKGFPAIRLQQAQQLMANIQSFAPGTPVIVCGDFNAFPTEPVYQYMSSHCGLSSAYGEALKGEPSFTSWKFRPGKELKYTIDYIWFNSNNLRLNSVLELPSAEEIGSNALPMIQYPSDHLSLSARFSLL